MTTKPLIIATSELLKILTTPELIAVSLHEVGHAKGKHSYLMSGTYRSSLIMTLYSIMFSVLVSPIYLSTFFLLISSNLFIRHLEYEADNYAAKKGYSKELISSLQKIYKIFRSKHNSIISNILEFIDVHPKIEDRIIRLLQQEETWEVVQRTNDKNKLAKYLFQEIIKGF